MSRIRVLIASSALIVLVLQSAFADPDPQANGLPGGLIIRKQAETFDAMVRQTKPDFVWNGTDMLWITRDASGRPGFTMDSAYAVQLTGRPDKSCCLFECKGYALGNEGPSYPYTCESDTQPEKIAQDSKWGTIYQARWRSVGDMGSGCNRDTRNVFLLCDGENRWHLLGDGPVANSCQDGTSDVTVETVKADVRWTGDSSKPAELSYTLLSAHERELDPPTTFSMTIRCKMVPNALNPRLFEPQGHHYVIADKSESLSAFSQKVVHCVGLDCGGFLPDQRQKQIYKAVEAELKKIDPSLANGVTAGANIILPDKLFGPHYADLNSW